MDTTNLKQHIIDVFKGLLGAMAAAALMAAVQYLGAHIPDGLQYLAQIAAAVGGVKTGK